MPRKLPILLLAFVFMGPVAVAQDNPASDEQEKHLLETLTTLGSFKALVSAQVPFQNGLNTIDLNADGVNDLVVSAYRSNITAHTFEVYSFFINSSSEPQLRLRAVAVADSADKEERFVRLTYDGADCRLADGRLVTITGVRTPLFVWAKRTYGRSLADDL